MKTTLVKLQSDYEKVLGQGHIIEDARDTLIKMATDINGLKIESRNISVKNEMKRSISGRLRDLDALAIDVETKISRIREDAAIVDDTEEKINKLNAFIVNNLSNKMKLLKEEMKTIDIANEKMSRFSIIAEEAEQRVQGLDEEIKKTEAIEVTVAKIQELSESTRGEMEELVRKRQLVDQVDKKINDKNLQSHHP